MIKLVAKVTEARFKRVGVRQWGIPSTRFVGKAYRSWLGQGNPPTGKPLVARDWIFTCLIESPDDPNLIRFAKARVVFVDSPDKERLPGGWRKAMAEYTLQWPNSAVDDVAIWAAVTPRQRIKLAAARLDSLRRDDINWPGTNERRWRYELSQIDSFLGVAP